MKFPIKFNTGLVHSKFKRLLPITLDPGELLIENQDPGRFSELMRVFKFGKTFKSTAFNRYPLTQKYLLNYPFANKPIVLDIGSSDGLASFGLIEKLDFKHYYLTDLNPYVYYKKKGNCIYFYDEKGLLILFSSRLLVIYPQELNGVLSKLCFNRKFKIDNKELSNLQLLKLINPSIDLSKSDVKFYKYNMFDAWPNEKVDLIILGNVLNRTYFNDMQILKAVSNLKMYCNEAALIVIIDNRPNLAEKSSIFKLSGGKIFLEYKLNQGCDIEDLVLQRTDVVLTITDVTSRN